MSETHWVGGFQGSRIGNLYWAEGTNGVGSLSVGQTNGTVLKCVTRTDSNDPSTIHLEGQTDDSNELQSIGSLKLITSKQGLRVGTYSLDDGSAGTFEALLKELGTKSTQENPLERSQVQIANKEVPLGAITLYRSDLSRILAELASYFDEPVVPIFRAKEGEQVIVRNAAEYLDRGDLPEKLKELTIALEANSEHGLKKIVSLTLSDDLDSKISVSSPDELWTEAVSRRLGSFMTEFTSTFTGFIRRHGLNINTILLVVLLIALPAFELFERVVLTSLAIGLMLTVVRSHKLIPFARIYLDPDRIRKPYSKELPSVIMGLMAAAITAAFSALPKLTEWITTTVESFTSAPIP